MNYERGTLTGLQLHLCDFDGTLTKDDSFVRFMLFAVPLPQLVAGGVVLIFKFLGMMLSGKWSNGAGKAAVLSLFFKSKTVAEMSAMGEEFHRKKMPAMLRSELLESMRGAIKNGETVAIVSASTDLWLRPFCKAEGFDLLCTELAFEGGKFTGLFAALNCNGAEKARRIRASYDLDSFDKITAYGNSDGDTEMFALADKVVRF